MSESPQDSTIGEHKVEDVTTMKEQADGGSGKEAEEEASEGGDDLFGAGDDDDDDDDDDDLVVSKPARQKRQIDSASPSPPPTSQAKSRARLPSSPTSSRVQSPTPSSQSNQSYTALEHRETSAEPPMGLRNAEEAQAELQEASFTLPSLPFRRGLPHYFARLPNLLQYRSEAFDEESFDEVKEDEMLQNKDGIRIDDEGLRSLLTTSNTIRWRWTENYDKDGVRKPESNARIVKWSDGSSSLQLGSEFYDISQTAERAPGSSDPPAPPAAAASKEASRLPLQQPVQHLTHLFIKHDGQEQINVYQAEAPIMGTLSFRPSSTASESHQRLAKAVRKQKGTLVKETIVREDPELEKERLEKEEKKRGQKRMREIKRKNKGKEDEDDDAFWDSAARSARRTGARSLASDGLLDGEVANGVDQGLDDGLDDDGFVVDDEGGEDMDGEGSQEDMDVDDEPDEMELMEAEMEKQEALRKAGKASKTEESSEAPQSGAQLLTEGAKVEEEDGATTSRKRRVIDSDDE